MHKSVSLTGLLRLFNVSVGLLSFAMLAGISCGQEYLAKKAHGGSGIMQIEFAADGKQLATVGPDQTVQVWDLSNKKLTRTFKFPVGGRVGLWGFVSDSDAMIVTVRHLKGVPDRGKAGWELKKCNIRSGEVSTLLSAKGDEWPVCLITGEERLVVRSYEVRPDGDVSHLLKLTNLKTKEVRALAWKDSFEVLSFSHSKKLVALLFPNNLVQIVQTETGAVLFDFQLNVEKNSGIAFFRDDKKFAAISRDEGDKLYFGDIAKRKLTACAMFPFAPRAIGDISPDGKVIVFILGKRLLFWNTRTEKIWKATEVNPRWWNKVRFAPDGATCVAGDADGNLQIIRTSQLK